MISLLLIGMGFQVGFAQDDEPALTLRLVRTFGYGGGRRIQGNFVLRVAEESGLERVEFLVDGEVVFEDGQPPFEYRFQTEAFALGEHTLSAVGYTLDERVLKSNTQRREFISAAQAWRSTTALLVPLLIGIGALMILGTLMTVLIGRGGQRGPGAYGIAGGAVCPRCGRPFGRRFFSPNLLVGKLERCPHCRKWSLVPRATPAELRAAEGRLADEARMGPSDPEDEARRLRRLIDESRFER